MTATSSSSVAGSGTAGRAILVAGAVLAGLNALLHLVEAPEYFEEQAYVGVLFVVGAVALLVAAFLLLRGRAALGWMLGAATSIAMLIAGVLSRTTGLPSFKEQQWEPTLIIAFALEIAFLVAYAVHASRRSRAS